MLRRVVAALALLTFLAYGEWSEARPCPMHDGVLAQLAMDGHQGTAQQHEMPGQDGATHHCTCIGDCGVSVATALPSPHSGWIEHTARPVAVTPAEIAYVAIARAHARPYSTAPPRVARIA